MLIVHHNFIEQLHLKILGELPGLSAQMKMAPPVRTVDVSIPHNVKLGGIVILIFKEDDVWKTLLMKRTDDGGTHSGQISFPGGSDEPNDFSITYTAIRELEEEMGINKNSIKLLGTLSDLYIPPSNFLVTPVVAWSSEPLHIAPSPSEVKTTIKIALHDLLNDDIKSYAEVYRSDNKNIVMKAPVYQPQADIKIWGATAMIIAELEHLIKY